ncbi:MAG: 5'-methylthioadenosine/S-adenosylhomocysteine nucleosidase [Chloroflexota bacterium]
MKVLILISADAEWQAVKKIFPGIRLENGIYGEWFSILSVGHELIYFQGGWGKISAAATAQYAIDHFKPGLIINPGSCGGFYGHIELGTIILVEKTIVYDIFEQMGDAELALENYSTDLDLSWSIPPYPLNVQRGLLISADRDIFPGDIDQLNSRFGAVAADWESGAIAWVSKKNNIRCIILRGVTDLVSNVGGDAYNNPGIFIQRTEELMPILIGQLEYWITASEKAPYI